MRHRALLALAMLGVAVSASCADFQPVDLVNPEIGSISHLLAPTFRTVQRPNAMYRFNAPNGQYTQDRLSGIPLHYPGHRDQAVFPIQPYSGDAAGVRQDAWVSTWDQPHARPYRYDVWLDTYGILFDIAPGEKTAALALTFERPGTHAVRFGLADSSGTWSLKGRTLTGIDVFHGLRGCSAAVYFCGEFETAPESAEVSGSRLIVGFGTRIRTIRLRFAVSYVSAEQAAANLRAEQTPFDLDEIAQAARARWNEALSSIEVEGGSADQRAVFYTALWRTFERMVDITEGGRYLGFDGKVHVANGLTYYTDDWTWDTWRAAHPLMTILRPKEEGDKMASFVRMAEDDPDHWIPVFPGVAGDRHCMVNRHTSVMFLDAWRKGIRNFDAQKAFDFSERTDETETLVPWERGPLNELDRFYQANGYYPALRPGQVEWVGAVHDDWEKRQSVSVTQGASLDAWAMAEFGRELGVDASRLAKYEARAKGYRQLWNPKTRFFQPKDCDGRFVEPFDALVCGGFGGRNYYTENNAWIYLWDVQHDIPGLIELMGGSQAVVARLDEMLNTSVGARWKYAAEMPDGCTGLMGAFTMANEPAFHIPYLYALAGEPAKTQKFVRKTLDAWFRNDRMGMCGDEDGGGMSAYVVFSMMGFYPVTPGKPEYQWGSPVFAKVRIRLQNGNSFVLEAPNASADAKYVSKIAIDGKPTAGAGEPLRHADIVRGATVRVTMCERP